MPVRHAKQVRFAYKNVFHSPPVTPPAVPSLTFSLSNATSSTGPLTPTVPTYAISAPPSSAYGGDYKSHPSPAYPIATSSRPHPYFEPAAITWDVLDPPSSISSHHQSLPSRVWSEPATSPPLPFIVITIHGFAWKFNVQASNRSFVTFQDVVESVYRSLRKNITEAEFHTAASPGEQRRATRAYEQRYRRQRSTRLYEEEKRGGMKRVDFLMGLTHFNGLYQNGRRSDEWRLSLT